MPRLEISRLERGTMTTVAYGQCIGYTREDSTQTVFVPIDFIIVLQ